jgi:hypothetical protein
MDTKIPVLLSTYEIGLLQEALDSHMYWQLSSEGNRDSGYVIDIDSEDEETREALREAERLSGALWKAYEEYQAVAVTVMQRSRSRRSSR